MFTLKKQQEIHFSHFVLQSAMHAARGCLPLIQLMSAHRVEICRVLYRAYFTNTLYILPSAYIAICTPWLSHPHILHTPSTLKICIYAACVDEIRKHAHMHIAQVFWHFLALQSKSCYIGREIAH